MKKKLYLLCISCLLFLHTSCIQKTIYSSNKGKALPNIILIIADDLGYADVGFNGCKDIPTPAIDQIAANGIKFTSGYVTYAVCGPSRAGLITGRYQDRFGFSKNPLCAPNDPNMGLPLQEETLATYLKKANYTTAALGKWHLGSHPSLVPNQRGFDEFFGFLGGGHQYFPDLLTLEDEYECKSQYDDYRTKLIRNGKTVDEQEYLTDAFSREAQSFIQRNQKNPFFLYLAYNAPHTPLQATQKYLDRFPDIKDKNRKTYAAMVSAVDDGIKNILSTLQQLDIEDNTIVFFISDNGGPTNANASKNDPLRGAKGGFFEGGISIPFVMQWKDAIPSGTIYENPISSLDIFATCASIVGLKTKNKLDGKNLIPYVQNKDKRQPHDYLFWRHGSQNSHAVRSENLKLVQTKDSLFLFDIINDKSEKDNKLSIKIKEKDFILGKYQDWNKQMIGPKFLGLGEEKEYELKNPGRFKRNR